MHGVAASKLGLIVDYAVGHLPPKIGSQSASRGV